MSWFVQSTLLIKSSVLQHSTVGSDLKGTNSDALGLLGSNTRVVLTKNDFFSEEISLGSAGMLMTARGKMIP